ncbi:hypothetical protein FQN54_000948 [Arachnomyces sp. PD_36]|nr:hypothetical protein FQN54_000948 [Arachnomyces sp. PD_36]
MASPNLREVAYASPETPTSCGTSSGRRSRRAQGWSEDNSIPLRIQSFRVGGPRLATPGSAFEVIPESSSLGKLWKSKLKEGIQATLQTAHIMPTFFDLIYYPGEAGTEPYPCLTIRINADAGESETEWIPVAEKIRRYCINAGAFNINVDLRDSRAFEKTLSYPVASSDLVVPLWESAKEEIIALLKGKDWIPRAVTISGNLSKHGENASKGIVMIQFRNMEWRLADESDDSGEDSPQTRNLVDPDAVRTEFTDVETEGDDMTLHLLCPSWGTSRFSAKYPEDFVTPPENAIHARRKEIIGFHEKPLLLSEEFLHKGEEYPGKVFAGSGLRLTDSKPPLAID